MQIRIDDRLGPTYALLPPFAMAIATEVAQRLSFLFQAHDVHENTIWLHIGFYGTQKSVEMSVTVELVNGKPPKLMHPWRKVFLIDLEEANFAGRVTGPIVKETLESILRIVMEKR